MSLDVKIEPGVEIESVVLKEIPPPPAYLHFIYFF